MSPKSPNLAEAPRAAEAPPRMSLAAIAPTRKQEPDRIVLLGVEGVGKSTFSAHAPAPIFIASEDGLADIDAHAFPAPQSFQDVLDAIDQLTTGEHAYRTLVIDSIDWIEPLIWEHLKKKNGWDDIEAPGYGKGYVAAAEVWRLMLGRLSVLWRDRQMEIHLIGHVAITTFQNPSGPDYSRFEPKIHKTARGLIKEWARTVLFATFEEYFAEAQKGDIVTGVTSKRRVKGVSTGARVIHTERSSAWDGKNRKDLPPVLPLDYEEYASARDRGQQADAAATYSACLDLANAMNLPADAKPRLFVEANKTNPANLVKALSRLRVLAGEAGV